MEADVVWRDFRRVLVSDKIYFHSSLLLTLKRDELAVCGINTLFISIQKIVFNIVVKKMEIINLLKYYNIINDLNQKIFWK